jgi:predicted nucleic acid-binding protein
MKIALDSNVFRTSRFIDFLILKKKDLDIVLPAIVQLEVGYYYKLKGHSWEIFKKEMAKFSAKLLDWNMGKLPSIIDCAFENRNILPFKDHFRDFLIGHQCEQDGRVLITYNTAHFKWSKKMKTMTPEDFILEMQ